MDFFLWVVFFSLRPPQQHIYYSTPKKFSCLALLPEKKWSGWWFQTICKIWVKMGIFPNFRGEKKKYLSCHHLVMGLPNFPLPAGPRCLGQVTPKAVVQGHHFETHLDGALWSSETPSFVSGKFFWRKKKHTAQVPNKKMPGTPSVLFFLREFYPENQQLLPYKNGALGFPGVDNIETTRNLCRDFYGLIIDPKYIYMG